MTTLISAYKQGFADGAEEQRCCFADETPHKDCINEGFQNWLANNPSIRAAQSDALREAVIEECAKALEDDAKQCGCFARNEGECGCGAWCEWKSITSARAVEIVRSLVKGTPFS